MTGISPKNYEPPSDNFYFEVGDTSPIVQVISMTSIDISTQIYM